MEGIDEALIRARKNKSGPTVIEFIIGREEYGLPIVTPGNPLNEMILESEKMISAYLPASAACFPANPII